MNSSVRPELPTASVGSSQAPPAAVDNSAPLAIRPGSTYKTGKAVQTNGATSIIGVRHPQSGVVADAIFAVINASAGDGLGVYVDRPIGMECRTYGTGAKNFLHDIGSAHAADYMQKNRLSARE